MIHPRPTLKLPPPLAAGARALAALFVLAPLLSGVAFAGNSLFWGKGFSPDTIGPGSVSTLTFTISNKSSFGVRGVAFTDVLPAGVRIADPANATIDCTGILSAPDGGTTISLTDGEVPGFGSCTITVDVTSATIGVHTNVSGDLTSDLGNSGAAQATLVVAEEIPGFSKSFSPSMVGFGGRSTLTFTIDNSANEGSRSNLAFTDLLPTGMVVADPANVVTDCPSATVTAVPGTGVVSLIQFGLPLPAFSSCTVSVDVIGGATGELDNISGELTSTTIQGGSSVSSGKASATLDVSIDPLVISKSFTNDPVPPGGTVRLEFTITNRDRDFPATNISFEDNLNATLQGLSVPSPPTGPVCGPSSLLTGTSILRLTGGFLDPGESCTFGVNLQVPASAQPGVYPNSTTTVTGVVDGSQVSGTPANDSLVVAAVPRLDKIFLDDPVTAGGTTRLRFRVTNTSPTSGATEISFVDELPPTLSGVVQKSFPSPDFCGDGSTLTFIPASQFDPALLVMTGGRLAPSDTCLFDVEMNVAPGAPGGIVTNTTEPITAMVDDVLLTGAPATADLRIVAAPQLTKSFVDDPVLPGGIVILEYTLTHGAEVPFPATDIEFTDNLNAVIPGMVAIDLPVNNVCGPDSVLRGTSEISFIRGELDPGETCVFQVKLQLPQQAPLGPVTNTTSPVTARVGGVSAMSGPATDELLVTSLSFTKEFIDDPVVAGGLATLEFTITNDGPVAATDISFVDDLDGTLSGLTATGLPLTGICGPSSSLTGNALNDLLTFAGGAVPAMSSCSFQVTLQVPPQAPDGQYPNAATNFVARVGNTPLELPAASDVLTVSSTLLQITKTFLTNPVQSGFITMLEFTIVNVDTVRGVTGIAFTDALPAGLMNSGGPLSNICGAGSSLTGTTTLTFSGGSLGPGGSCTFAVPILVPAGLPPGQLENTTSNVSGTVDGGAVCPPIVFDFEFPDGTTDLGQGSVLVGNANFQPSVQGGRLQLTSNTNSNNSAFHIPAQPNSELGFHVWFEYEMFDPKGGNPPADGFAFNYGNFLFGSNSAQPEEGFPGAANNISWEVDTWRVGDAEVGPAIGVNRPAGVAGLGNSLHASSVAHTNGDIFLDGQTIRGEVHIDMHPDGTTNFTTTGAITNAAFNNIASGFALNNNFGFALAARTGGANEDLFIDNLRIEWWNSGGAPLPVRGNSASAELQVIAPGTAFDILSTTPLPNGTVSVKFIATPGRRYCIEWSEDLDIWTKVLPAIIAEAGLVEWIDVGPPGTPTTPAEAGRRFYRIVESP